MKVRRKRNGNDLSDLAVSSWQRSRPWTESNTPSQFALESLPIQAQRVESVNLLSRVTEEQSPLELSPDTSQRQQPVDQVFRKLTTQTDEMSTPLSSKPFWLQKQTAPTNLQPQVNTEDEIQSRGDTRSTQFNQNQGSDRQLQLRQQNATSIIQRNINSPQLIPQPRSGLIQRTEDEDTTSTSLEQTPQRIPPDRPLPPLPPQNNLVRDRRGAISAPDDHLSHKTEVGFWATDTLKLGGRGTDFAGAAVESTSLTGVLQDINSNASRLEGAVEGENWLSGSQILQKIGQSFVNLGKLEGFGPIGTLLSSLSLFNYITSCIDTTQQRNLLKLKATAMGINFNSEIPPKEQIQERVGQIDVDLADAFVHGYQKLSRRIPRLFARIVNSIINLSTLLLDLISGGMTLLVTQSIRTFSGVLMALDSLSRVVKGMFKKYKNTKGKHRLKSAKTLMHRARQGNLDAAEAVINLLKSFSADDEYSALQLTGGDTKRALLDFFGASTRMTPQQCTEELQKMDNQSYEWMTENLFAKLRSYV